ncbi:spore germination protein GerPC [Halalkalibacter kiskunsagensis]|uniref:Spore germination protein GerPC n=1 Tax=Halalkalibacter kiskunsagensis TaxID=1548599 RepID=A0ABV6KBE2_9BACI
MYYNNSDLAQNLQQIYNYIHSQHQRITQLETTIQQLQNEMETLKKEKTSNIEKIEYKFDQLKVERLEGTLNIGITPQNGEHSIEDFAVNQNQLHVPQVNQQQPMINETVQQRVYEYLNGACLQDIESIEVENNYQLDNHYRQYIIEDIRRQVDHRINHYVSQINTNSLEPAQVTEMEEKTFNKVREDILKTYDEFVRNLPRKENLP